MSANHSSLLIYPSKRILAILVLCILFLINGCNGQPTIRPGDTSTPAILLSTETPKPEPSLVSPPLNIPIGIGVYDSKEIEIFNKYAEKQDVIAFRSEYINFLRDVKIGQKMLVLSPRDEPFDNFYSLVAKVLPDGVTWLGYNLETALTTDQIVNKEKDVADLADRAALFYMFGPTLAKLSKSYADFSQNADVLLLQAQRFQARDNFESEVEDLVGKIKSSNSNVKVWVQVSVNPPEKPDIAPEQVIEQIRMIADKADLIWIYYTPRTVTAMEEVLKGLRQSRTAQTNEQPTAKAQLESTQSTLAPSQTQFPSQTPGGTQLSGYLCGYWTFARPSELPLSDLRTYTNIVFYVQDAENGFPDESDLRALRENRLKLVLKLDTQIVETTFDRAALEQMKLRLDQYKDVVYAVWPIDEPYRENRTKHYTYGQLEELVRQIKEIFPGYPIWVNFLTPTITGSQQGSFPGVPENIDIISTDIYLHSTNLTEENYKAFINENLAILKESAGSRPLLFASRSFAVAGASGTPLLPEQVEWDADLVQQNHLLGLAWYFYDDSTPEGSGYGARHFPEVLAKQRTVGLQLINGTNTGSESTSTPSPAKTATQASPTKTSPTVPVGVLQHMVVVAVEQQTALKYPDVQDQMQSAIEYVNQLLTSAGIQRQFTIQRFAPVYDKTIPTDCKAREDIAGYLPDEYCRQHGDYVFIVVDETTSKNYPNRQGPSVEWHGLKEFQNSPPDSPHFMFIPDSLHVFGHELGHVLGLPDLYILRVAPEDDQVSHQGFPSDAYEPFANDIMFGGTFGDFSPWDKEIIDRENRTLPAQYNTWYDYQPDNTVLKILSSDGLPLESAEINVYSHERTPEHKQVIDAIPEYTGRTDSEGLFSIGASILGSDRNDSVMVFPVEIKFTGQVDIQWFSFMDVNYAYWENEPIEIKTNITHP